MLMPCSSLPPPLLSSPSLLSQHLVILYMLGDRWQQEARRREENEKTEEEKEGEKLSELSSKCNCHNLTARFWQLHFLYCYMNWLDLYKSTAVAIKERAKAITQADNTYLLNISNVNAIRDPLKIARLSPLNALSVVITLPKF